MANAEHTASVTARWNPIFTTQLIWVSDQGSHFKNEVMAHLAHSHPIRHNFTVTYSPWSKGTVALLIRSIFSSTRAMLADFKLAAQDWNLVLTSIMTVLNEAGLPRFGFRSDCIARSALEVLTGIQPNRKILRFIPPEPAGAKPVPLKHVRTARVNSIWDPQHLTTCSKPSSAKLAQDIKNQLLITIELRTSLTHHFMLATFCLLAVPQTAVINCASAAQAVSRHRHSKPSHLQGCTAFLWRS